MKDLVLNQMPKFKKETEITKKSRKRKKKKKISEDEFSYRTILISAIICLSFLVLSFFFNGTSWFYEGIFVEHYVEKETLWEILDNTIKVSVILFAFFFMMISLGNYKELTGKPIDMKEMLLLVGLSLIQTFRNIWVFTFTLISLPLIMLYFYVVQER